MLECPCSGVKSIRSPKSVAARGDSILMLHPAYNSSTPEDDVSPAAANTNTLKPVNLAIESGEHFRKEMNNSWSKLTEMP